MEILRVFVGLGIVVAVGGFWRSLSSREPTLARPSPLDRWMLGFVSLWGGVVVLCVVAAAVGYVALGTSPPSTIALIQSFAAGSILAMLAITMMPQAFTKGGRAVGIVTVIGFILAAGLSAH